MRAVKKTKKLGAGLLRIAIFALCGAISLFLLASGYESLYNRSLPLVHTLDPINFQSFANTYNLQKAYVFSKDQKDESIFGTFGAPTSLKLPGRTKKLDIVPAVHPDANQWLARANTLHVVTPEGARSGNIGVALLYCRSGFRTLDSNNLPAEGSNLFMDTDKNWRYVYKIISVVTNDQNQTYIPADSGEQSKLLISCNDSRKHTTIIIEANLLTVQGVEL
jgi:hypothetical protein